jgi:hypothetical protein
MRQRKVYEWVERFKGEQTRVVDIDWVLTSPFIPPSR